MSKKNLLNESTIRKFMKLASIEPLASDFISKIQEAEEDVEEGMRMKADDDEMREGADKEELDEGEHEDEVDEGMRMKADDDDVDEGMRMKADDDEMREGADKEELDEDVDLEERGMMYKDDDDMGGEDKMVNVADFLDALEVALEKFLGEPVEIEDEEEGEEMDMDMEMDMEEPEGEEMDMDMEMDMEEPEEDLAETIYREVLKRITK